MRLKIATDWMHGWTKTGLEGIANSVRIKTEYWLIPLPAKIPDHDASVHRRRPKLFDDSVDVIHQTLAVLSALMSAHKTNFL